MEAAGVRRVWLEHGGNAVQAARALGISRQMVDYYVRRAPPLRARVTGALVGGTDDDATAFTAYLRSVLARARVDRA